MNGDSFFKQLKQLCRVVEQGLQGVTQETENNQSKRGPAGAIKRLVDLKTDIQDMQVKKANLSLCDSHSLSLLLSLFLCLSLIYFQTNCIFFLTTSFSFFPLSLIFSRFLSLSKNILPENFDYFINGSHGASEQYFLYESIISMLKLSKSPKKKSNKIIFLPLFC